MLNPIDLQRVAVEKAAAVLVLCDKFSRDPCKKQSHDIYVRTKCLEFLTSFVPSNQHSWMMNVFFWNNNHLLQV